MPAWLWTTWPAVRWTRCPWWRTAGWSGCWHAATSRGGWNCTASRRPVGRLLGEVRRGAPTRGSGQGTEEVGGDRTCDLVRVVAELRWEVVAQIQRGQAVD